MADLFFRAVVLVSDGLLVVRPTGHVHQLANAFFLSSRTRSVRCGHRGLKFVNRRTVIMSSQLDSWMGDAVLVLVTESLGGIR